jgi:hypothetical protein
MPLDATHQNKDEHDHQDHTQNAGRKVAEATRVTPIRQCTDEQQNEDDDENCAERHVCLLNSVKLALSRLEQRNQKGSRDRKNEGCGYEGAEDFCPTRLSIEHIAAPNRSRAGSIFEGSDVGVIHFRLPQSRSWISDLVGREQKTWMTAKWFPDAILGE